MSKFTEYKVIHIACVFRGHPDSDSGLSRTSISVSFGQVFLPSLFVFRHNRVLSVSRGNHD